MSVINLFKAFAVPVAFNITVSVPCDSEPEEARSGAENKPLAFEWKLYLHILCPYSWVQNKDGYAERLAA